MNSILNNRPALAREVNKVAEVAGYLWEKGWAERNGGNITVNITEYVDDEIRALPAISEVYQIGATLPYLKGCSSKTITVLVIGLLVLIVSSFLPELLK